MAVTGDMKEKITCKPLCQEQAFPISCLTPGLVWTHKEEEDHAVWMVHVQQEALGLLVLEVILVLVVVNSSDEALLKVNLRLNLYFTCVIVNHHVFPTPRGYLEATGGAVTE